MDLADATRRQRDHSRESRVAHVELVTVTSSWHQNIPNGETFQALPLTATSQRSFFLKAPALCQGRFLCRLHTARMFLRHHRMSCTHHSCWHSVGMSDRHTLVMPPPAAKVRRTRSKPFHFYFVSRGCASEGIHSSSTLLLLWCDCVKEVHIPVLNVTTASCTLYSKLPFQCGFIT
ncbi:hypothetical protein FA13DRAFT_1417721 [Coprinellus micaceus]|uniref:Uncharacterized protein n=1 Tax=Coprinellus micaceus TaxID=71717 RepID=A0A4Y7SNZ8_COPMI|nr:hypothetical protein FA13DRAFT_1417721 [Coprinellus micaceus]